MMVRARMPFRSNSFFTNTEHELAQKERLRVQALREKQTLAATESDKKVAGLVEEALDALEVEDNVTLTHRLHDIRDAVSGVSPH